MSTLDWLALVALLLALALNVRSLVEWVDDRTRLRHRRVMVHTSGRETTFGGVLWSNSRHLLVLRDASTYDLRRNGEPVPLDGEVVIERERVEWIHLTTTER